MLSKYYLNINFLADYRSKVVAVDIVCPGFVDIHTHGIGGHEDVIQELLQSFRNIQTNTIISYSSFVVLDQPGIHAGAPATVWDHELPGHGCGAIRSGGICQLHRRVQVGVVNTKKFINYLAKFLLH